MTDKDIITNDSGSGRVAPIKRSDLLYNWGPQAWIDMWISNSMLVKKAMPIISHTSVPILRLSCNDRSKREASYLKIKSRRETIQLVEAPHEKWRKRYGNLVREMEWALLELCPLRLPHRF